MQQRRVCVRSVLTHNCAVIVTDPKLVSAFWRTIHRIIELMFSARLMKLEFNVSISLLWFVRRSLDEFKLKCAHRHQPFLQPNRCTHKIETETIRARVHSIVSVRNGEREYINTFNFPRTVSHYSCVDCHVLLCVGREREVPNINITGRYEYMRWADIIFDEIPLFGCARIIKISYAGIGFIHWIKWPTNA